LFTSAILFRQTPARPPFSSTNTSSAHSKARLTTSSVGSCACHGAAPYVAVAGSAGYQNGHRSSCSKSGSSRLKQHMQEGAYRECRHRPGKSVAGRQSSMGNAPVQGGAALFLLAKHSLSTKSFGKPQRRQVEQDRLSISTSRSGPPHRARWQGLSYRPSRWPQ
jgi:hypothetical protein